MAGLVDEVQEDQGGVRGAYMHLCLCEALGAHVRAQTKLTSACARVHTGI